MISKAYIFGSLGKAAFQQQGNWFMLDADEPDHVRKWHSMDRNYFALSSPETIFLDGDRKLTDLKTLLALESKKHEALTLALQLMDEKIAGEELNNALATLLEKYLSQKKVLDFVENRLLSTIVPATFQPKNALETCEALHLEKSAGLYRRLTTVAESIGLFYTVFQKTAIRPQHFSSLQEYDAAYTHLTENGIAKAFVLSVAHRDRLEWDAAALKATNLLRQHDLLQNATLFTEMRQELAHIFEVRLEDHHVPVESEQPALDAIEQMIEEYLKDYDKLRSAKRSLKDRAKLSWRKAKVRIKDQVIHLDARKLQARINDFSDKIVASAKKGESSRVNEYLTHLLQLQFKNSDPKHICMSLSSISGAVMKVGDTILAADLLKYARMLNANDPFVHTQYAEILKSLGELDQAKTEYLKIKKQFPKNDVAQKGYAEILKAEGNIIQAKAEYQRIKVDFPNDIYAQTGYAEILKAEGKLDKAKAEYQRIKKQFPDNVVTQNGYAEILKSEGKLGEAKVELQKILTQFPSDQIALHSLINISLLLNEDIRQKYPVIENPNTLQDHYWYHLHINRLIKEGDWERAKELLLKGIADCAFYNSKLLYKRTLKYLQLQNQEFDKVIEDLQNIENTPLDHAFNAHAYAALGKQDLAKKELNKSLQFDQIPVIKELSHLLNERFNIIDLPKKGLSRQVLDLEIPVKEYEALLMAT